MKSALTEEQKEKARARSRAWRAGVGVDRKTSPNHPCKATIDHKLPIKQGGTNDENNLVAACRYCNVSKNAKTAEEFFVYLAECRKVT